MSFLEYETSSTGFSPIEIYTFTYQGIDYRYNSGQEELTVNTFVYQPVYIIRDEISSAPSNEDNALVVTVAKDNPVALFYLQKMPVDTFSVVIERFHWKDPAGETRILYTGSIQDVIFKNGDIAEISVAPITNLLARLILRPDHQAKCNHVIYDEFCTLSRTLAEVDATVVAITDNGTTVEVDAIAAVLRVDQYIGGSMKFGQHYATILTQGGVGNRTLGTLLKLDSLQVGSTVKIAPGCQNSYNYCKDDYSNQENNLGFKDLPRRNPVNSTMYGDA